MQGQREVMNFYAKSEEVALGIAADHGAGPGSVERRWCFGLWVAPPTLASGAGQLTHQVYFCVEYGFATPRAEVARTRRLTLFRPDGMEGWPAGQMRILTGPARPGAVGCTGRVGFFLHVGNRMAERWGFLSGRRERSLARTLARAEAAIEAAASPIPTVYEEGWMAAFRNGYDLGVWAA